MRKTIQELNKIADDVVGEIWGDERLYLPVYRDDIKSEEQANAATNLPLLYIWNERVVDGHPAFSFSIMARCLRRCWNDTCPEQIPISSGCEIRSCKVFISRRTRW